MLKVSVRESVCIVVVYAKQILEIIIKLFTYIKFLMILYILFFFFIFGFHKFNLFNKIYGYLRIAIFDKVFLFHCIYI